MKVDVPGEFTEVRIPVPWGHMAGRWYGDQLQRPILALHGWLDNCGTFAKLAPLLMPHASLLCVDLPGHGYSSHLPIGVLYTNMEYVRAIRRLMLIYDWPKVSLMGHSMGGSVAFHFAAIFPDKVDLVIGIDILHSIYAAPRVFPNLWEQVVERALVDNERLQWQKDHHEPPSYTIEECEQRLYEGSHRSVHIENCKYILERNVGRSLLYPEKYYFSRDSRVKYLAELNPSPELASQMAWRIAEQSIPYLVVRGGASTFAKVRNPGSTEVLTRHNPHFEVHQVVGTTHHLHLNDAEQVAAIIIPFLQRHRPLAPHTGAQSASASASASAATRKVGLAKL